MTTGLCDAQLLVRWSSSAGFCSFAGLEISVCNKRQCVLISVYFTLTFLMLFCLSGALRSFFGAAVKIRPRR